MAEQNERWERIERGIEYLIHTSAQHETNIAKYDALLARHDALLARHDDRLARHDDRLDRIEASPEEMIDSQKQLLTAQVIFVDETRRSQDRLDEQMRHTDERLNALIATVDSIIRHQPPAPPMQ